MAGIGYGIVTHQHNSHNHPHNHFITNTKQKISTENIFISWIHTNTLTLT